jgi:cytochrome c-type biogenesis protein CcmH
MATNPNASSDPKTPEYQARLRALSEELRCLVCQNQSLADSNAELALDLKREVERMMVEGKTDAEIKTFLVQRYGDFVLYKPPVQTNTLLLWGGPFALLFVGGIAWRIAQRKSKLANISSANGSNEKNTNHSAARKLLD